MAYRRSRRSMYRRRSNRVRRNFARRRRIGYRM
jgi:hypothetical protein